MVPDRGRVAMFEHRLAVVVCLKEKGPIPAEFLDRLSGPSLRQRLLFRTPAR